MLTRNPQRGKWPVVDKALDDWGKTARLAVLLIVMAICMFGPPILAAWFFTAHGHSASEVCRIVGGLISR